MKHITKAFLLVGIVILTGSCDSLQNQSGEISAIPKVGQNPLPTISGTTYKIKDNTAKGKGATNSGINWTKIKPLLKQVQKQTNSRYVALYSVRNSDQGHYYYRTSPLEFSPKTLKEAEGKVQPYFFESTTSVSSPSQLLAAYIPDSKQAIKEMQQWILSKPKAGTVFKDPSEEALSKKRSSCFIEDTRYYIYDSEGNLLQLLVVGHYEDCGSVDGGGGGGGSDEPVDDVNCPEQLLPPPECSDGDEECPPPYYCNGGGGGGGIEIFYYGEIDASDLANHPKANCVYGKLSQTNTMKVTVSKFAGESTNFDLVIEVTDMAEGINGSLSSSTGSNTFTMLLNRLELDRTPIEIAGTFLHEAVHAEMRRYLYGATDTSTLPGFPGDFTDDWKNYILVKYGAINSGAISDAEHNAMAEKYVETIANGLEEYDNNQLNRSYYEALAWNGLIGTEAWNNLTLAKRTEISVKYYDALESRSLQCQ